MNRIVITSALLVLLIAQIACLDTSNGGGYVPPENDNTAPENTNGGANPADDSIGTISRVLDLVWAGRGGDLTEVSGNAYLYNNGSVKITDGGKATLAFHNDINLTLYNDTSTGAIYGEVDPSVPNYVRMKLERGGVLGQVAKKGNTAEISVAYGSTVRVVGTAFYVVYDEETGFTSVGNYDGELYFNPNGAGEIFLPAKTQVDIAPDGALFYYELPNDPDLFDALATDYASPRDGLRTMREKLDQPPPGGGSPDKPVTTVFRTLVKPEGDSFYPDLAESWEVNDTGDVITFRLYGGTVLPDGEPFTAWYVRDRLEKDFYYAQQGFVSFEVVDDLTIQFYLYSVDYYSVMKDLSVFEFEVQLGPILY
ncbi:MAG: hypothetical protein AB1750_03215 [Chloroflexota bacterium]